MAGEPAAHEVIKWLTITVRALSPAGNRQRVGVATGRTEFFVKSAERAVKAHRRLVCNKPGYILQLARTAVLAILAVLKMVTS
jgi:hypothetical protein